MCIRDRVITSPLHGEGRRFEPGTDLSLIHISEPTRLLSIGDGVETNRIKTSMTEVGIEPTPTAGDGPLTAAP